MTTPATVENERGTAEEAEKPPVDADNIEAVRQYMLQLLSQGRGEEAIDMLVDLLGLGLIRFGGHPRSEGKVHHGKEETAVHEGV